MINFRYKSILIGCTFVTSLILAFHSTCNATENKVSPLAVTYQEQLFGLTKQMVPKETFVFEIQNSPVTVYSKFYNNQFDASHNKEVLLRIISDINSRLASDALQGEEFENHKQALQKLREDGVILLGQIPHFLVDSPKQSNLNFINASDVYFFVMNYVDAMYDLLKSQDEDIKGTYYTDFAKDFLRHVTVPGNNSQLYFTFENLDEQYFIDIRPLCMYPVYLMTLPEFTGRKPLIPTQDIQGYVESKLQNFREVTFHDIGHAYVMNRQDKWLFETCHASPQELVTEWLRNKDWYMNAYRELAETNYPLSQAVKLYLFEMVHDRGYQFYLPILKQQFNAAKNFENFKSRILRGEFDISFDRNIVQSLDEARAWLLNITDQFIVRDNLEKIEKYKGSGYLIKKYPDIESCAGVPTGVTIRKDGRIMVDFDSDGSPKTTSLYEIELITVPVEDVILSEDKIHNINKWMNALQNSEDEFIHLDRDANVKTSNFSDNNLELGNEFNLKKIEIFKLERLLKLIKNKSKVRFSISNLPYVYDSNDMLVNQEKGNVTIDTGLVFKLNEISVECPLL